MNKTRVLVIDDSAFNRRTISEMLEKSPHIEVIGTASDGEEGLKKAFSLKPDIITVDLEMPIMNGFTFLRLLMSRMPIPVIVVSSRDDDANVFKALEFGAVDFLAKPTARISRDLLNIEKDIISKVRMVSELRMDNIKKRVALKKRSSSVIKREKKYVPITEGGTYDVLAIGSSTGGPPALQSIFTALPKDLPLSIVVSQHMPSGFTKAFAERLNRLCDLRIKEAEDGDKLDKGSVLIAPGGTHMTLFRKGDDVLVNIMSKSLFCAGTTWPGVFLFEDQCALDVLTARAEVDRERIGCAGLSGGGLRTVYLGGLDHRIKCAVSVGFMSTWSDFLMNKSYTHTWMTYAPLLPKYLDFPEILGLRVPLPTMTLNNNQDGVSDGDRSSFSSASCS